MREIILHPSALIPSVGERSAGSSVDWKSVETSGAFLLLRWLLDPFVNPLACLFGFTFGEVANLCGREWLAEQGHSVLPRRLSDHRQPLDVPEVLGVELDVLPQRATVQPWKSCI